MNPYTTLALARMLGQGGQSYLDEKRRIEEDRREKQRQRQERRLRERDYAFQLRKYETEIERQNRLDREAAEEKVRALKPDELLMLLAKITPEGYVPRPEVTAPLMEQLGLATGGKTVPQPPPFVNQREQGMAAKMGRQIPQQQFTPPQVQSPYVAAPQQPLDPRAAQVALTQAWQELRQLNQYNPNDPAKASLEARIRWLSDAVGVPVAEGSFAVDPMKVVEGERIRQGDEALDIKRQLAESEIRYKDAMMKIGQGRLGLAEEAQQFDEWYKKAQIGFTGAGIGLRQAEIIANLLKQLENVRWSESKGEYGSGLADSMASRIKEQLNSLGAGVQADAQSSGGQAGTTGTQKTPYDQSVKEAVGRGASYEQWRNKASKYVRADYPNWSQQQRETWLKAKWRANGGK